MRPQVPIAGGIALFVLGAILRFAVAAGHVGGVDVHVVGIILMFAGVAALLIPLLLRGMTRPAAPSQGAETGYFPGDGPQDPLDPPRQSDYDVTRRIETMRRRRTRTSDR